MKLFIVAAALLATLAVVHGEDTCAGCPESMDISEAETLLQTTLSKLAALDGPYYRMSTVNTATKQVVAGVLYTINVDLIDMKQNINACDVKILQQPWLDSEQVTFNCPYQPEIVKSLKISN